MIKNPCFILHRIYKHQRLVITHHCDKIPTEVNLKNKDLFRITGSEVSMLNYLIPLFLAQGKAGTHGKENSGERCSQHGGQKVVGERRKKGEKVWCIT